MYWLYIVKAKPFEIFLLQILLPVGISFFTFQAMSYTSDVYRRKLSPGPITSTS